MGYTFPEPYAFFSPIQFSESEQETTNGILTPELCVRDVAVSFNLVYNGI